MSPLDPWGGGGHNIIVQLEFTNYNVTPHPRQQKLMSTLNFLKIVTNLSVMLQVYKLTYQYLISIGKVSEERSRAGGSSLLSNRRVLRAVSTSILRLGSQHLYCPCPELEIGGGCQQF